MPSFSANLNFLFNEVPFMDRFAEAAQAGFKYVEFMFPYDYDQQEIKRKLEAYNLKLVLCNLPAGDWGAGDRGLAADPARKEEFKKGVSQAIESARLLGVNRLNCLVGKVAGTYEEAEILDNILANVCYAADEFHQAGLELMIEPINHFDMPGFYLNTTTQVIEIIQKANRPNLFLQYDIYHAEREGEKHEMILAQYFPYIGHVQVADNPGRNEPGTGVVKIRDIFDILDQKGYKGFVGMEYKPTGSTLESLSWVKEYGYSL
ncbi:MAG TPA: TIM barrel protein [Peptococcaceae bacterium]|nr:TIM barrel protein [Peptococcaceae bacterium]